MLDALDTEPEELGPALNAIGASPATTTAEQLENTTLHILSQKIEGYKKQEMRILEQEHQIMLSESRKLDEETDSEIHGMNVCDGAN